MHFDLPLNGRPLPTGAELQRSLNALLPDSVRVVGVEPAPEVDALGRPWHSRLWATGKLYSYRVFAGQVLDPLERRQRHLVGHRPLDVAAMSEAANHLHGRIDCAAFANRRAGEPPPCDVDPEQTLAGR